MQTKQKGYTTEALVSMAYPVVGLCSREDTGENSLRETQESFTAPVCLTVQSVKMGFSFCLLINSIISSIYQLKGAEAQI